jgi:UDP-perosamine 4-acetyltransferase
MSARVLIYGASSQAVVALEVLRAGNDVIVDGFLDDDAEQVGRLVGGVPVLGGLDSVRHGNGQPRSLFVAIGSNPARLRVTASLTELGLEIVNAVHPGAIVMAGVEMGTGNLICAGAVVVTGTRLGDSIVLNTGATIDHDCEVKTGAYMAPGVHTAGRVVIGGSAFIGIGASIGPGVRVGERSVVGAGSVLLSDIPPDVLAFGTPARVVRELTGPLDWQAILAGG